MEQKKICSCPDCEKMRKNELDEIEYEYEYEYEYEDEDDELEYDAFWA